MSTFDRAYTLVRWIIGGVFIYAGSAKLLAPEIFAALIEAYGIVPGKLLMPLAVFLPALEVIAGIGLLFDVEGSLAVIGGLLVLFTAIVGYGIRSGLDVDCGCFGPGDPEAEAFHGLRASLYRDLMMILSVVCLYGWRRYRDVRLVRVKSLVDKLFQKGRTEDAFG